MCDREFKKLCNFHPFEVVGRGSETQLQVGEFFFKIAGSGLMNLGFYFKEH